MSDQSRNRNADFPNLPYRRFAIGLQSATGSRPSPPKGLRQAHRIAKLHGMKPTFFLPCALSLLVAFSAEAALPAHSATEPIARFDGGWQDRHQSFNRRVAEVGEKAQVIFIGDSITQGWEGAGKEVWARYYAPRNAVNLGIGGDRTQHVLWRLDNGNLQGLKPKAAVVMIGTNNSNGEDNTPGQIADGVAAIVKKLRDKLPDTKVLLVAIFPRSENFSAQRGKLLQVNQVIRKLADGKDVFWMDFGHRLVTSEGLIPRTLMPDFLHLSPAGYKLWAEAIENRLSSILGDTPVAKD
jgi:beta-glucosidase